MLSHKDTNFMNIIILISQHVYLYTYWKRKKNKRHTWWIKAQKTSWNSCLGHTISMLLWRQSPFLVHCWVFSSLHLEHSSFLGLTFASYWVCHHTFQQETTVDKGLVLYSNNLKVIDLFLSIAWGCFNL